jgi:hypothetical protein
LIYSKNFFGHYVKHVLRKFIKNGYHRVEFRAELVKLSLYDENGKFICKLHEKEYAEIFDEAYAEIERENPEFSVGFIFYLMKSHPDHEIEANLAKICELNWARTMGVDFVQEEDRYGSLERYDKLVEKVLSKYPNVRLWKVYHAG